MATLVLASRCPAAAGPAIAAEPKKAEIRLSVLPNPGMPGRNYVAVARVRDLDHELHCPEVTWSWGEWAKRSELVYCDPYAHDQPTEYRLSDEQRLRRPGEYEVKVELRAAGKTRTARRTVTVIGGSE